MGDSDSDDDLMIMKLAPRIKAKSSSSASSATAQSSNSIPAVDSLKLPKQSSSKPVFDLGSLLREQAEEKRKIDILRNTKSETQAAAEEVGMVFATSGDADDEMDEAEIDKLAADIRDGRHAGKAKTSEEEEMDWDRDFLLDWMGLTSVFHMQESEFPPLAFAECVRASDWGHDYEKLYNAFTTAETKGMLPDMLCLRTPVRWLEARDLPAPPKLLDWLLTLVALSECPLTSYGALVNFQGFLKAEEAGADMQYRAETGGWRLTFATLARVLRCYGVRLEPRKANFVRRIETSEGEATLEKSGIAPTVNLRQLVVVIRWAVEAGCVELKYEELMSLVQAFFIILVDRHVQSDGHMEVQELVCALLEQFPSERWPAPALPAVTLHLFDKQVASLGDASLLQIARSVLLDTERGREVAASLAKRLLEQRLLPPNLAADLNPLCPTAHAEAYLNTILHYLLGDKGASVFTKPSRTLHICCCLELLSKSSRSRVPRSYLGTLAEGFRQVVSTVLPKSSEQDAQMAKDVLMQDIKFLQNLAPRQGVQTTLTSFRRESVN